MGLLLLARARFLVTPGNAGLALAAAATLSLRAPTIFFMTSTMERLLAAAQVPPT